MTQFALARRCGWRYEWIAELDPEVLTVILEELHAEDDELAARS